MRGVERGDSFTITRNGTPIGRLIPIRRRTFASGRGTRRRIADLMIASVAHVHGLPLYTTNPTGFSGLAEPVTIEAVQRPDPR